jgi:hypothetical protein
MLYSKIPTVFQILFKKPPEEGGVPVPAPGTGKPPILKDYGMDPEHRKFVFAEEYTSNSEKSLKDEYNKEDRELGVRRKSSNGRGRFHEDKRRLGKFILSEIIFYVYFDPF